MTDENLAIEILLDYFNAVEVGIAAAKQRIKTLKIPEENYEKILEEVFNNLLSWEIRESSKLGVYQVHRDDGSDAFKGALIILKRKKATIKTRFYEEGYVYSFWIFNDAIYRKKLTTNE